MCTAQARCLCVAGPQSFRAPVVRRYDAPSSCTEGAFRCQVCLTPAPIKSPSCVLGPAVGLLNAACGTRRSHVCCAARLLRPPSDTLPIAQSSALQLIADALSPVMGPPFDSFVRVVYSHTPLGHRADAALPMDVVARDSCAARHDGTAVVPRPRASATASCAAGTGVHCDTGEMRPEPPKFGRTLPSICPTTPFLAERHPVLVDFAPHLTKAVQTFVGGPPPMLAESADFSEGVPILSTWPKSDE